MCICGDGFKFLDRYKNANNINGTYFKYKRKYELLIKERVCRISALRRDMHKYVIRVKEARKNKKYVIGTFPFSSYCLFFSILNTVLTYLCVKDIVFETKKTYLGYIQIHNISKKKLKKPKSY